MSRVFLVLLALCTTAPEAFAQQLPPPQNPAATNPNTPPQGPTLIAPQNAAAARGLALPPQLNPPPARLRLSAPAQPAKKNAAKPVGKPPEYFAARRQAQIDRKQAQIDRMKQFKAARAVEQQKLYQDWHERYLDDTPVRVEYYRALSRAYEADAALAYRTPYFYAGPPVFAPIIYTPFYQPPIYGTFIVWCW